MQHKSCLSINAIFKWTKLKPFNVTQCFCSKYWTRTNGQQIKLTSSWKYTFSQLSIMIIYNSTWSMLIQLITVIIVSRSSDLINTKDSIFVINLMHEPKISTERGGYHNFAELCIAKHCNWHTACSMPHALKTNSCTVLFDVVSCLHALP